MSSVFYVLLSKMKRMGFKENLKAELAYKNILVKELASISGVNRRTIDNYLRENSSVPSADAAVRIAAALGVTVEYLITGQEWQKRNDKPLFSDARIIIKNLESLNRRDQKIVINLIKSLREMENSENKATRGT
ncbi:MAG: helix-turn-helix domain-containing protein [Treponema sp.]|jgi:transcriptional regulator with XRE-family HTH domain|nr:helix-turn-helix domain-containing protein [Treponema sp.]